MNERHRQSVTISAKTVDDAIVEAERELGVPRDRLDITVITEGSKGFLGMRAENARILAMVVSDSAADAVPSTPPAPREAARPRDIYPASAPATLVSAPETAGEGDELEMEHDGDDSVAPGVRAQQRAETAGIAQEILETLLRHMDLRARVSIRSAANPIILDVETDAGGLLIGRRGDTLSALQYIVNVLVGKRVRGWTKIVIDVEHWRERREETLRTLALRQADRVRQQRRPIALDPMPANERRIIHLALQDLHDVETHSEGEEPNRRLVITPKK